jgi:subtilisin family serine protease
MKSYKNLARLTSWLLVMALLGLFANPVQGRNGLPGAGEAKPGEVLVKFRSGISQATLEQEAERMGLKDAQPEVLRSALLAQEGLDFSGRIEPLGIQRLTFNTGRTPDKVLRALRASQLVEYAEPNYQRAAYTPLINGPDDAYYQSGDQWWVEAIAADKTVAESLLPSGAEVVIAVLDTGIRLNHEDLAGRLVPGRDYINSGGQGNDDSDQGHGTLVAGIAAAQTNNGIGVAGTAVADINAVKLMPVKVLDAEGQGYDFTIAAGITWAVDHGARVINLSLGGADAGIVLKDAVLYAYQGGCVVVAAAGNEALEGNPVCYPAAYDHVISVAACNYSGSRAGYSVYNQYVDVAAPGGDEGPASEKILSTFNSSASSYAYAIGTSMACPIVSGVAAMLLAQDSNRTPDEVENLIVTTAEKTGSLLNDTDGWNQYLGWGRANLYQALTRNTTFTPQKSGRPAYNYPNPYNPNTGELTYIVIPLEPGQTVSRVRLCIYDAMGRLVRKIEMPGSEAWPGKIIAWDGKNGNGTGVANGVYPFTLELDEKRYRNKIAVLR